MSEANEVERQVRRMTEVSFDVEVGRLICRHVRDMLESEVFAGRKIRFREGAGWITRTFSIIGDAEDVARVKARLDYYRKCTGDST